jgi:phage baseplate assembly protein W
MATRDISLSFEDGRTLTGADAILQQYEIALFTIPTEFHSEPGFGIGLEQFIGEPNSEISARTLRQRILATTRDNFPEIKINSVQMIQQENTLTIQMDVTIVPYAQRATIRKDVTAT